MNKERGAVLHFITNIGESLDGDSEIKDLPQSAPLLATRNMVLFPNTLVPIMLGRQASLNLLRHIRRQKDDAVCVIFSQKDPDVEEPEFQDLYRYGVYARLVRVLDMHVETM